MDLSRRSFLHSLSAGGVAAALHWPASGAASGSPATESTHPPLLLNSTGNAYGPSERVQMEMRRALSLARRFPNAEPDSGYDTLGRVIADFHGVHPGQVLIGCGSTEVQRSAVAALLGPGERLVMARPTFDAIERYVRAAHAEVVTVPLNREFGHDLDGMLTAVNTAARLVYICNPNNPTGTLTYRKDLEIFIGKLPANTCVIIDEAYHHFAVPSSGYQSFIDHPMDDARVIVTRSFSKIHGLAGLRIGYAISAAQTIEKMRPYQLQDSVNVVAMKAALAALRDTVGLRIAIKHNEDARQEFVNQAVARMLRPLSSHTNFVMVNTGHPASEVIRHFKEHNILIGPPCPALESHVRISYGRREEMRRFWQVWDLKMFHPGEH